MSGKSTIFYDFSRQAGLDAQELPGEHRLVQECEATRDDGYEEGILMDFWIMCFVVVCLFIALFKVKSKLLKLLFLIIILFLLWVYQSEWMTMVQQLKSGSPKLIDLQTFKDWLNHGLEKIRQFVSQYI